MKVGLFLLHVAVVPLAKSTSNAPSGVTRPRNRPTALRASSSIQEDLQVATSSADRSPTAVDRVASHSMLESPGHLFFLGSSIEKTAKRQDPLQLTPTDGDEKPRTAAELTGVKANHHGHFSTSGITCAINLSVVLICTMLFSLLRLKYPLIYSGNAQLVKEPQAEERFLGWLSASLSISTEHAAETVGLDAALMIEFCNMACKILAVIGIPMACIMCPLHYLFGGKGAPLSELGSVAMGNVVVAHPWLYYVHAIIVNIVTFFVIRTVYSAMPHFLKLRYKWMKNMPAPRCQTVLVEGIPEGWRTDAKLKEFFTIMFKPEFIAECAVVKDAPELLKVYNEQAALEQLLEDYKDKWQAAQYAQEDRPMMRERACIGKKIDAIDYIEKKLAELKPVVAEARTIAIRNAEDEAGGSTCSSGFVTFSRRREAEVCHNIAAFSSQRSEWKVSVPPPASDVRWRDLKHTESKISLMSMIGYSLTLLLFVLFIPIVVVGTNLSDAVYIGGPLQPVWDSFAPGLALMLFLALLPTILLFIFSTFFALKSETFAQHKLQNWYFLFMLFFVILVTVVGRSLLGTFVEVLQNPGSTLKLLAEKMPTATDFYMDFLMLQWGEQSLNFLRWVVLAKFILFRSIYEDEDAKRMAEPEDQDFYGIGSRSARFTISLLVGIIFSSLSPLVAVLGFVLFVIMRIYYGYLVVYAEIKKPDLGGVFYETQLQHLILGLALYNVLMLGVICFRAGDRVPMVMVLPSLIYTVGSYWHFSQNFVWQGLPFVEVCQRPDELKAEDNGLRYIQPEFAKPAEEPSRTYQRKVSGESSGTNSGTSI